MKKISKLLVGLVLLLAFSLSTPSVSAQSIGYERVTWEQLNNEGFNVNSITKEDLQKAEEIAAQSLDSLFRKDEEGFATMDISSIESEYGAQVANVFKLGLANINLDIKKGVSQFAPDNKSLIKGPNYDKYAIEDNQPIGTITLMSCTWKGGTKAILGAAAGGAVVGAVAGVGGALPGGVAGGMAGGIGFYATCWW